MSNGFLVRPALVGSFRPHNLRAGYIGFNGDGHIGFLNLTNSYYFAFGQDGFNPIAGKKTDIRAHMAAAEASIDRELAAVPRVDLLRFGRQGPDRR